MEFRQEWARPEGEGDGKAVENWAKLGAFGWNPPPWLNELDPPPLSYPPPLAGEALAGFERWLSSGWLLGEDPAMRTARELILRYAKDHRPVLIDGESGTGKDLVAKAIHLASCRWTRPWVIANLAGLGETAYAAIFGYLKGAYTGAWTPHDGFIRRAHGSTLILLEVTAIPTEYQTMLLRALETKRFLPIKAESEEFSDFRVIAMTNEPAERAIAEGRFRLDFYSRLKVLTLSLPPLRDRLGDLDVLVPHFLRKVATGDGPKTLTGEAMEVLQEHSWPGNVRELEHLMAHAVVRTPGPVIQGELVRRLLRAGAFLHPGLPSTPGDVAHQPQLLDPVALKRALEAVGGNKRELARRWRISTKTLYALLREADLL